MYIRKRTHRFWYVLFYYLWAGRQEKIKEAILPVPRFPYLCHRNIAIYEGRYSTSFSLRRSFV